MGDSAVPRMDWDEPNLCKAMQLFRQRCLLYFSVKEIKKEKQTDHLLLFSGNQGLEMYNSWGLSDAERKDPDIVWKKFETQLEPKSNYRIARLYLQRFRQKEGESIDDYISRCKLQAFKCKFRDDQEFNERIIEQVISGTRHAELQKDLLGKDKSYTLDQVLDTGRTFEASDRHMKELNDMQCEKINVNVVKKSNNFQGARKIPNVCLKCGRNHASGPSNCPAYGTECSVCGKLNHWKRMCLSLQENRDRLLTRQKPMANSENPGKSYQKSKKSHNSDKDRQKSKVHTMYQDSSDDDDARCQKSKVHTVYQGSSDEDVLNLGSLQISSTSERGTHKEAFTRVKLRLKEKKLKVNLRVKIDTGAGGNAIPVRLYKEMFPELMDESGHPVKRYMQNKNKVLIAYNDTMIRHYGSMRVPCRYRKEEWIPTEFYIVESDGPAVMGLPSLLALNLVTLNCSMTTAALLPTKREGQEVNSIADLVRVYPEQFDCIGKFPGEYHIVLRDDAQPVVHAQRKFPIQKKKELKENLEEMERLQVITKTNEPTDWVNSMVCTRKENGSLRICLDPKDLNRAIKRCHHRTPTQEEITYKLHGAKIFSKLDAKHGYWSVKLDDESSFLTTFNTPYGRYRYLRMPFGLSMSQDVFQLRMDQIIESCPGIIGIADDVVVFGKTVKDHDENLHNLFKVAKQHGLTFNSEKCKIKEPQVKFYGSIYDKDGVRPDTAKIEAINSIPTPHDVTGLQRFLGMITYLSPFIPKMADETAALRSLLKKDAEFVWTASHDRAFQRIKEIVCKEVTLSYFDPNKPTTIQVDASLKGLGAALVQDDKPIAFASKSLSETEKRYVNIEREMLAVVFGCERFHTYIYGKEFTVESDHKPLEMIQLKNLTAAPARLQRMLMRLQHYDAKIVYRPGKELLLADGLSRLPLKDNKHIELDVRVNLVHFSKDRLSQAQEETNKDEILTELREVIIQGWPKCRKELPVPLLPYWAFRDELSIEDGLVIKGERVVIPKSMQEYVLSKIHEAHQGIVKCQLRAKDCVYWTSINKDIENVVRQCPTCQEQMNDQSKEPLMPHELPTRPWQYLGTDLFHYTDTVYLIVCDYYSKFPVIRKMPSHCTSQAVIDGLKRIFSEYGVPERLISDNGRQYDSAEFKNFAKVWEFDHITSSPHYPQSNGFIERTIQTIKNTLIKAKKSNMDSRMALLTLRTTPIDSKIPSPAELLSGRKMRGNLPMHTPSKYGQKDQVFEHFQHKQGTQKKYFDQHSTELSPLMTGQYVRFQDHVTGLWNPATVVGKCPEPRSYMIETPNGSVLRRNRRHIRDVPPPTVPYPTREDAPPPDVDDNSASAARPISPGVDLPEEPVARSPAMPKQSQPDGQTRTKTGRVIRKPSRLDL